MNGHISDSTPSNYDLVYDAIRKDNLTISSYTENQCTLANTIAYKCNGLVLISTRCTITTGLQPSTAGRQILTVYGAVAPAGSHMIIAMYDGKPLMCWISGQSVMLRNDTELPTNAIIYITGTYPCN